MWQYTWSSFLSTITGLGVMFVVLLIVAFMIALIEAIISRRNKPEHNIPIMNAINNLTKAGICYVWSEDVAHEIQILYKKTTEVGKLVNNDDSCWYVKEIKE